MIITPRFRSPFPPSPIIALSGGWAPLIQPQVWFSVCLFSTFEGDVWVWETYCVRLFYSTDAICMCPTCHPPPSALLELKVAVLNDRRWSIFNKGCVTEGWFMSAGLFLLIKECNLLFAFVLFNTLFCILIWAVHFQSIQSISYSI